MPFNMGPTSRLVPGRFEAIQVLSCGHKINTGLPLRLFNTTKGMLTECPEGCGQMKTKQVESGTSEFNCEFFLKVK